MFSKIDSGRIGTRLVLVEGRRFINSSEKRVAGQKVPKTDYANHQEEDNERDQEEKSPLLYQSLFHVRVHVADQAEQSSEPKKVGTTGY